MGYEVSLRSARRNQTLKVKPFVAGSICQVDETMTHVIPNTYAEMSVTFNYYQLFRDAGLEDSLKSLYGMTAKDSIPLIEAAIKKLGSVEPYNGPYYVLNHRPGQMGPPPEFAESWERNKNCPENDPVMLKHGLDYKWLYDTGGYWKATPGNAGFILVTMLWWATQKPNGVWCIHS
jgi:hypothetical protein